MSDTSFIKGLRDRIAELEKENKRLKEDLAECDDLREELDFRKRETKRLEEEIDRLNSLN